MVAHDNVGANCHTLHVAAGNLRLTEKQVGCGHKQRFVGIARKDRMPQSVPRSKHTVIIRKIVQIIIPPVFQVGESLSKVL